MDTPNPEQNQAPGTPPTLMNWKRLSWPRLILVTIVGLVGIALVLSVISTLLSTSVGVSDEVSFEMSPGSYDALSAPMAASRSRNGGNTVTEKMYRTAPVPEVGGSTGSYNEADFETLSYSATVKTAELEQTCDSIEEWKALSHVMFETSSRGESRCRYTFKVEQAHAADILAQLEALDPSSLDADTQVLKKQLTTHASRMNILLQKQALLEETLRSTTAAYDRLVAYSEEQKNVEVLANVVDKKIAHIERLSTERIRLSAELDALSKSAAELADRIAFVYFSVNVYKYEIFNGDALKDSWVGELRTFVYTMNSMLQALSIGLITNLLWLLQGLVYVLLYGFILLFVGKYGWHFVKKIWQS